MIGTTNDFFYHKMWSIRTNPNRKAKTPHLEDNLVIIKDPKRTRVYL